MEKTGSNCLAFMAAEIQGFIYINADTCCTTEMLLYLGESQLQCIFFSKDREACKLKGKEKKVDLDVKFTVSLAFRNSLVLN